jgi:hypothetical protein
MAVRPLSCIYISGWQTNKGVVNFLFNVEPGSSYFEFYERVSFQSVFLLIYSSTSFIIMLLYNLHHYRILSKCVVGGWLARETSSDVSSACSLFY